MASTSRREERGQYCYKIAFFSGIDSSNIFLETSALCMHCLNSSSFKFSVLMALSDSRACVYLGQSVLYKKMNIRKTIYKCNFMRVLIYNASEFEMNIKHSLRDILTSYIIVNNSNYIYKCLLEIFRLRCFTMYTALPNDKVNI